MKKTDGRSNEKVRRICRAINNQADDRQRLRTLMLRLQEVLGQERPRQERIENRAVKITLQSDDPFDKILVA